MSRLKNWDLATDPECTKHGEVTNAFLNSWLTTRWEWSGILAPTVASAVGGHHGAFLPENRLNRMGLNTEPWSSVAAEILDGLATACDQQRPQLTQVTLGPWIAWLSGFVSVADWLGSHEGMVLYAVEPANGREYLARAEFRAKELLASLGFAAPCSTDCLGIDALIPNGAKPNSMQRLAHTKVARDFGLAIVESPTGEGKTEAALALAEPSRAEGSGLYFALPTMATANGLVDRVNSYLRRATRDDESAARLLHSMAWLYRSDARIIGNSADSENAEAGEDWFAGSKRGLLAPYAVGTVDQALTGAILVKHFYVRLFALAGKVVVIDEVHAYDVYMSRLLSVLLAWLRALDCQVVLLSATLPRVRRDELFRAWGCNLDVAPVYPCITWTQANGSLQSETFDVHRRKPLEMRPLHVASGDQLLEAIAMLVKELQSTAKTACIIANTVREAQRLFAVARSICQSQGINCQLFHARFTAEDRQRIERNVLTNFGKAGDRKEPQFLIATQVVEQSLDLDFDVMVSQLAPIDLLIQRAGRLHRHRRDRDGALQTSDAADARPNPVLWVTRPSLDKSGDVTFANPVYCEATLAATWDLVCDGLVIAEPKDVALAVDQVYTQVDTLLGEADESEAPSKHLVKSLRKRRKHESAATEAAIVAPDDRHTVSLQRNPLEEDDDGPRNAIMARTRLEELNSLSLVIARPDQALPHGKLSATDKWALVLNTVRVSLGEDQLRELLELPQGDGWTSVRMLRHCRLAQLDANMQFETQSYQYRYSATEGLMWEKKDA